MNFENLKKFCEFKTKFKLMHLQAANSATCLLNIAVDQGTLGILGILDILGILYLNLKFFKLP